jgi:hypothetical protein
VEEEPVARQKKQEKDEEVEKEAVTRQKKEEKAE